MFASDFVRKWKWISWQISVFLSFLLLKSRSRPLPVSVVWCRKQITHPCSSLNDKNINSLASQSKWACWPPSFGTLSRSTKYSVLHSLDANPLRLVWFTTEMFSMNINQKLCTQSSNFTLSAGWWSSNCTVVWMLPFCFEDSAPVAHAMEKMSQNRPKSLHH